jgi:beta-galactosidase
MPDQAYQQGGFGHVGGDVLRHPRRKTVGSEVSVKGTENDPVYQTQLVGIEAFKWDVPQGTYELSLLFAELKTKGEHIMDIEVNGKTIWANLNVKQQYGSDRGVAKRFLITVADTHGITVTFKAKKGKTRLSGIKLRKVN